LKVIAKKTLKNTASVEAKYDWPYKIILW